MGNPQGKTLFAFATMSEACGVFPWIDSKTKEFTDKVIYFPDRDACVAVLGVGSVEFSANLAKVLSDLARDGASVSAVVALGICGAYPESKIQVGEVVRIVSETVGDLGFCEADGSFVPWRNASVYGCDEYVLDLFPALENLPAVKGLTVNSCTGTASVAANRVQAFGCQVESMEGAAAVSICNALQIPVMEIRAVSNIATTRDRSQWKIKEALEKLRQLFA